MKVLATLTAEEMAALVELQKRRDNAALKVGVAVLEQQQIVSRQNQVIAESVQQEKVMAANMARAYGIDPDRVKFTIDYENGTLVEID